MSLVTLFPPPGASAPFRCRSGNSYNAAAGSVSIDNGASVAGVQLANDIADLIAMGWSAATGGTLAASQTFLWNGSATTGVAAASAALTGIPPGTRTVTVTAGAGVTALAALIQGSTDGVNWHTFGYVSLSAPGSDSVTYQRNWPQVRVNITNLVGGNASGTVA